MVMIFKIVGIAWLDYKQTFELIDEGNVDK